MDASVIFHVVMCGLPGSGKSTLLASLRPKRIDDIAGAEKCRGRVAWVDRLKLYVWDSPTKSSDEKALETAITEFNAIVFIVDSTDEGTLADAATALRKTLKRLDKRTNIDVDDDDGARNDVSMVPLLILLNKADASVDTEQGKRLVSVQRAASFLDLEKLGKGRNAYITNCSALTSQGVIDGLDWLWKAGAKIKN